MQKLTKFLTEGRWQHFRPQVISIGSVSNNVHPTIKNNQHARWQDPITKGQLKEEISERSMWYGMIRSHCKTNVFVVFHKRNHTVCTHMFVLKGKNWKRMLASAYWPPAHPNPPTHNSHPQVTLGSLDCFLFYVYTFIPGVPRSYWSPPRWRPFPAESLPYSLQPEPISFSPIIFVSWYPFVPLPCILSCCVPDSTPNEPRTFWGLGGLLLFSPHTSSAQCWALWRMTTGGQ